MTMAAVVVSQQHATVPWTSGLCGCFEDFSSCAYACCCPWCANASARTNFDGSNWCFNCCCVSTCVVRNIVREAYNIEGTCLGDLCVPCWCGCCSTAQVLRESAARGSASAVTCQTSTGQVVRVEAQEGANQWTSGLCACFDDIGYCAYACCCPWCATASAVSNYDGSNFCFNCCAKNTCVSQSIIREGKYNISGTCMGDIWEPCCCQMCAISRMLREVKARGNINQTHSVVRVAPQQPMGQIQQPGMAQPMHQPQMVQPGMQQYPQQGYPQQGYRQA